MKINHRWTVLAATALLLLVAIGCGKKKTPTPVPAPVEPAVTEPTTEMPAESNVGINDPVEPQPEPSIEEMQRDLERRGLLGDVFYDFDRYELRAEARERLAKNAEYMNTEGRSLSFRIEGHCDERGTNEYNIALGERRSTTALDYLVSLGVDRSRFQTVSFGEERPFCVESNEACWQQNRRARFVITGR